jgi:undecaprenyl phosphate-alpha-L-ara4N flippase subunit ArnE
LISAREGLLLIVSVTAIAGGQIVFKLASLAWLPGSGVMGLIKVGWLLLGLLIYGLATLAWLTLLRTVPLSVAYPFFSLAFLIVPLLSWSFLDEPVRLRQWMGATLIAAGVWVSVR